MTDASEPKKERESKYKEAREHMRAAHQAMHESMKMLLPEGFIDQRKKARKELLLGIRSMIDAAIEHSEK